MPEEYVDPEFPEMGSQPEEIPESEGNPEPEVFGEEFYEETPLPDEFQEQVGMELVESSPDVQEGFLAFEYPPREAPTVMNQDSGGVLFLPDDDPIRQPVISEPLDPRLVYTRSVPKRLRHLTCERRGAEYHRPAGLYRPGG
jgi:hypothetical protein